jgi:hypothetical protein
MYMFADLSTIPPYLQECMTHSEFKRMLFRIISEQEKRGFQSLAVVSDGSDEERSLFTMALGMSYATFLRRRVLLLSFSDTTEHLRIPFGTRTFPVVRHEAMRVSESGPHLCILSDMTSILTRENPNQKEREMCNATADSVSTEFLLKPFLKTRADYFDLILIDTQDLSSCVPTAADPVVIASQTDRTLFLLKQGKMEAESQRRLREAFESTHIHQLGAIIVSRAEAN